MGEWQPDSQADPQSLTPGPAQVPYQRAIGKMQMAFFFLLSQAYPEWNQPSLLITQVHDFLPGPPFQSTETISYQAIPIVWISDGEGTNGIPKELCPLSRDFGDPY